MAVKIFQTNNDRLQQEYEKSQEDSDSKSGKSSVIKLKKGITMLRVMPPWSAEGMWFKEFREHYIYAGGQSNYFNCLTNWKKNCPLCAEGKRLYTSENEDNMEKSKGFRPRKQFLLNAIVLSAPGGENTARQGIQVIQIGAMAKDDMLKWDRGFAQGWGDMTDLQNGFDISIERQGEGLNTRYPVTPVAKRTNIVEVLSSQGIDFNTFTMNDLNELLVRPTAEELQEVLSDDYVPYFPSSPEAVEVADNPNPGTPNVQDEPGTSEFPVPVGVEVESPNPAPAPASIPVPEPFTTEDK